MTSVLKVDQIETVSGTGTITIPTGNTLDASSGFIPPAGSVVQHVYESTTTQVYIGAVSTWTELMSVTFTPLYNNSRIVIQHSSSGIQVATTANLARIVRTQDSVGTEIYYNGRWSYGNDPTYWVGINFSFTDVDVVSSTSPITYSLQSKMFTPSTDSQVRWNDNGQTSYLHVWEIKQ